MRLWTLDQLFFENNLMNRDLVNIVYDTNLSIMEFNSLISAIPREWKQCILQNHPRDHDQLTFNAYEQLNRIPRKMVTKHVYTKLINRIAESVNLQGKWANHIHNEFQNTEKWFSHIYKITIDNVLRSF